MAKQWLTIALVCLGWLLAKEAEAQFMPHPGGCPGCAPGHGEPMPIAGSGVQGFGGVMPAGYGYGGHPKDKDLLGDAPPTMLIDDGTPNAFFRDSECPRYISFYASLGALAYKRYSLGNSLIATQDLGVNIPNFPQFFDHGMFPPIFPPNQEQQILNTGDINPIYSWGGKGTIGYQYGNEMFEVTGWWMSQTTSIAEAVDPNRVNLPFANFDQRIGFLGNNNLFLQADIARIEVETLLANVEANYRWATGSGWEWLIGLRYFDMSDRFSVITFDDIIVTAGLAPVDRTLIATYTLRSHTRILGPSMGFEGEWPVCHWLAIGGMGKGTWGANFSEVSVLLQRGDDFVNPQGPDRRRTKNYFSHMYELGGFLDFLLTERFRIRAGYQALWVCNVAEAQAQINFDLNNQLNSIDYNGSVFFHGPMLEFHVGF